MSWQEDLAELDRSLAEGRISADDYRRRRDELLSAASGPGTPPPPNSGPFAAPFRWEAGPPANSAPPNPDATQVVNTGKPPAGPDAERTQYVRPVTPPAGQPNQMPPQGWQSGPPTTTPPWGGGDGFGPVMDPNPGWLAQGPEVFEEKSGGGKRVLAIVGVVVVLALIGGGIWFFTQNGSEPDQPGGGSQTVAAPTTTTTTKPKDDLSIAELPGKVEDHSNITSFADAMKSNFLTPEEIAFYTTAGAGKARLAASRTTEGVHVLIFTAQATAPAAADVARDGLAQQQITYGMQEYPSPSGVQSGQVDKNGQTPATIRGHYSSKSTVIRIQVNGDDLAKVSSVYDEILAQQLEVLAPND